MMLLSSAAGGRRYTIRAPEYLKLMPVSSRQVCFSSAVHVAANSSIFFTVAFPNSCEGNVAHFVSIINNRRMREGELEFFGAENGWKNSD